MSSEPEVRSRHLADERSALRSQLAGRRQRLVELRQTNLHADLDGLLAQVDSALARIDGAEFGICTHCHGEIEIDRLRSDPTTTVCLDCLNPSERRALEQDLEAARQVQASLLPPIDFQVACWTGHQLYRPHGAVSGDYVDVVAGRDNASALVMLGDVSGKGVAAALLMSQLHALFRAASTDLAGLSEIVARTNRSLCSTSPSNRFATLVACRLFPGGSIELVNAGHPAPLVVGPKGSFELATDGLPLGMFCNAEYSVQTLRLGVGEALVLYSDGLSESRNSDEHELGSAAIAETLRGTTWSTAADLVRAIDDAAKLHRHGRAAEDDLSVLALTPVIAAASS